MIQKIVNLINNKQKFISIRQVLRILEKNPKIKKLNSHVKPIVTHGFV